MAVDKNQIKQLLGTGLSNEVVATAVGCDPSYISQLMSDSTFAEEVVSLRTASLMSNSQRDKKIDGIEDGLIAKLSEAVESGMIYKPNDILRAFATVNAAKRRGVPAHENLHIQQTVVNLQIPKVVVQNFTVSGSGEVIEADGQTLVTMPAAQLINQLSRGGKNDKYAEVAKYLPSAAVESQHG